MAIKHAYMLSNWSAVLANHSNSNSTWSSSADAISLAIKCGRQTDKHRSRDNCRLLFLHRALEGCAAVVFSIAHESHLNVCMKLVTRLALMQIVCFYYIKQEFWGVFTDNHNETPIKYSHSWSSSTDCKPSPCKSDNRNIAMIAILYSITRGCSWNLTSLAGT